MNVWIKALLAAASGLACYWIFVWADGLPVIVGWLFVYGLSGLLFAAGVLFPYLRRDKILPYRGLALVLVSIFSYWSALQVVMRGHLGPGTEDMLAASVVGAAIVLVGTKLIIPLQHAVRLALLGLPAAIIGGLIFAWSTDGAFPVAYMAWHMLIAAVIYSDQFDARQEQESNQTRIERDV